MNYEELFADRTRGMSTSAIREIFKVIKMPGMISLAGGVPALETFAIDTIRQLSAEVIEKYGPAVFQYGITEGFLPLRSALAEHLKSRGITATPEEICISTGAQNAIDAAAKIFLNKGDKVGIETPTFLAAIKAFKTYEAVCIDLPMDDDGVIPEELERIASTHQLKFIYLIPTFQNPSGRTLTAKRREQIAEVIQRKNLLVLEDDPYFELRYSGSDVPPIKSLAPDHVIYVGSLSKVFSPGMRLGYYLAPEPVAALMTSTRQANDVHSNHYAQALAAEFISQGHLENHLPSVLDLYRERLNTMLTELEQCFGGSGYHWSSPEGGMFVWLEAPENLDIDEVYQTAIEEKVAFVPGKHFFATSGSGTNTARLNFTSVPSEKIRQAISTLGSICNR